ncbi:MAG: spore germination protein [Bacillota bacterium]
MFRLFRRRRQGASRGRGQPEGEGGQESRHAQRPTDEGITFGNMPDKEPIDPDLNKVKARLDDYLGDSPDIGRRDFKIAGKTDALAVFVDGLVDKALLNSGLLRPLILGVVEAGIHPPINDLHELVRTSLTAHGIETTGDMVQAVNSVPDGTVVIFIQGSRQAILATMRMWATRSIEKPEERPSVRGPKEAFTETLRLNTSLVRRRVRTPLLRVEDMKLGTVGRAELCFMYVKGLAADGLVQEVRRRLNRMDTDISISVQGVEECLEDHPLSLVPTAFTTERPDEVAAGLADGRVAIMLDGTPEALIVPTQLSQYIQAPDDYYTRWPAGTVIRWFRMFAMLLALAAPAVYVALITYHQEMIPQRLLMTLAQEREVVPLPALLELLLMEATFEILREAGLRLPRPFGQAVSIVGGLVIGDAAVLAGLVSPGMVITVALTAVASFAVPELSMHLAIRIARFALTILGGFLGFFGVLTGLLFMLVHVSALRSFGVPFLAGLAPVSKRGLKDLLWRAPAWATKLRPEHLSPGHRQKKTSSTRPDPYRHDEGGDELR